MSGKDLEKLIKKFAPQEIIVIIPSAKPSQMRKILKECKKYDVMLKTLPSLKDVITGDVSINQIKDISIEDLLFREPVRALNRDLILLYWDIGQAIVEKQKQFGWGESVIDRLSRDLLAAFPDVVGFSPRNLRCNF